MSATESSEFVVPESVENEKEESKEIKATKRPAEVSSFSYAPLASFFSVENFPTLRYYLKINAKRKKTEIQKPSFSSEIYHQHFSSSHDEIVFFRS